MAKNDIFLIDGIIEERIKEQIPSSNRGEVFEFFVFEQLLKDYDLSRDEIYSGWTDGEHDGGIDGFFIFVNGIFLDDADNFHWPKSNASIDVWIITCKHHDTYEQQPLDLLIATTTELFDFAKNENELKGQYSEDILECRSLLFDTYRKLSMSRPEINFHVIYASRGGHEKIGSSVLARSEQIKDTIKELFSSCRANFSFIGSQDLVEAYRRSKTYTIDLPFLEHLATGEESYILLASLYDYFKFVADENSLLRRYLFDSNVRDYLGTNNVNEDIKQSLEDETELDFWWLNNGITILATNATITGKSIKLQNIQIVNGLQTTETIFKHFISGSTKSAKRSLLVKIIVSTDLKSRDQIIRATNNQSPIEIAALHATDKIQRDIEEVLERHDLYYERRRNYYRNVGKPQTKFITPTYIASAVVALIVKNPAIATRLKTKFMRNETSYGMVFSEKIPLNIWPILAKVYKNIDIGLSSLNPGKQKEKFIATWRPLFSLLVVAKLLKSFGYSTSDLQKINSDLITSKLIRETWDEIEDIIGEYASKNIGRPKYIQECCNKIAGKHGLEGVEQVGKRHLSVNSFFHKNRAIDDDLKAKVEELLPKQPWSIGIHRDIASKLGCSNGLVSSAIQQLIAEGVFYRQEEGKLYDKDGNHINK